MAIHLLLLSARHPGNIDNIGIHICLSHADAGDVTRYAPIAAGRPMAAILPVAWRFAQAYHRVYLSLITRA